MIQAKVLWYSQRDGNGIVKDAENNEIYIDNSVLKCDNKELTNKRLVSLELTRVGGVLCGKNVQLVEV